MPDTMTKKIAVTSQEPALSDSEFDFQVRVTISSPEESVQSPQMDGWTTYTSCMATCGGQCGYGSPMSEGSHCC